MKPTDITDALNDVEPGFVSDAAPKPAQKKRNRKAAARFAALAAVLVVLICTGTVVARRGAKNPTPPIQTSGTEQDSDQNDVSATAAQPTEQEKQNAQSLLRSLTVCAAEYPAQTPYPAQGDASDQTALDAWYNAVWERRQAYYGAGKTLDAFFIRSLPAFLGGKREDNAVCSPLNIYFSLAMLAEISGGSTRAQVLSLLGSSSIETLRTQVNKLFNAHYRNDGSAYCILADSLWLNEKVPLKNETLKTLAQQYYASSYRGEPGTEAFDNALRAWINSQTGGLLQNSVANIKSDPLTVIELCSTAYFGDKWMAEFQADATEKGSFHSPAADIDADFMHATDLWGRYYWGQRFGAVKKDLRQTGTVWFILPDEGVSPEDLLKDEEVLRFLFTQNKDSDWQNAKSVRVNLSLPKFDVSSQQSLKEGLQSLGVTDCFTEEADFSPLTDGGPVAVSEVRHGARVIADETGVTAAAYTEMMLSGAAMPPEDEMDFVLDRPFLFAVMSDDNMPLFVGIVNRP